MESNTAIHKNKENDYNVNISFNNLTWRNILVLEDTFKKYGKELEDRVIGMSEAEKESEHYSYRIQPTKEALSSISKAILEQIKNESKG